MFETLRFTYNNPKETFDQYVLLYDEDRDNTYLFGLDSPYNKRFYDCKDIINEVINELLKFINNGGISIDYIEENTKETIIETLENQGELKTLEMFRCLFD